MGIIGMIMAVIVYGIEFGMIGVIFAILYIAASEIFFHGIR